MYLFNIGFLLGTMIASVSPAVVVPCLFRLREVGYGVDKGIPTLVLAAAAIDDSVSVATFAIILNYMFSTGSATFNIIKVIIYIYSNTQLINMKYNVFLLNFTGAFVNSCRHRSRVTMGKFSSCHTGES